MPFTSNNKQNIILYNIPPEIIPPIVDHGGKGMTFSKKLRPEIKKSGSEIRNPTTLSTKCDGYFFLRYPHFGHTPSSLSATPHSGQRSMSFLVTNSAEAAFTPLVKVILAMLSLSFSRS